jgi:hypothetical protein
MKTLIQPLTTFIYAAALLIACDDLDLADRAKDSSTAGQGGTLSNESTTRLGGTAPKGGSLTTVLANDLLGGASSTTRSTGSKTATGGSPSTTLATGGAASIGGTSSIGGTNGISGMTNSASATFGGNGVTGGATSWVAGGQSSTVSLSGGTASIGGSSAIAGEPSTGGTVGAGGASASSAGNAATQWQPCLSNLNQYVTAFAQAPESVENMLVGCSNGDVFITFDGLAMNPNPHWIRVDDWTTIGGSELGLPNAPVNAIAYSPSDVNTAYLAFAGSKQGKKLWKTTTGGTFWEEITSCPLSEIWSVSVNPLDAQTVYLFGPGGAFMSPDSGNTWTSDVTTGPMNVPLALGAKLSTVSVAPGKADVIWVGATNGDVYFTNDATSNKKWYLASRYMPARAVTHLGLDTSRTPIVVYATFDGMGPDGLWATANNGVTWSIPQNDNLPVRTTVPGVYSFYGVSVNPINGSVLYIAGTYGFGYSTSGGVSWTWTDLF